MIGLVDQDVVTKSGDVSKRRHFDGYERNANSVGSLG
jgi:hypothetical protein